ncbi:MULTISPECIES: hypothetical protein [Alkalihalophilus]|uniref:Uncharacterized protein n=1 Tax=Alkalihalophilus pseudofirmus (strain ATCC BAA-2126 / JCM 17055 / OF4) TaxID=398511 RepID=D3G198_ALKPO|nr:MULTISPECIES: hypothetical protein [Alkalihalophilus]ADC52124.1 hypothetical protein BpOF4_20644 [Alkalihalophilus pseudofirmus OF4]MEC2074225.1 hypothetical protein [Alkalihalophilus marmarensis]
MRIERKSLDFEKYEPTLMQKRNANRGAEETTKEERDKERLFMAKMIFEFTGALFLIGGLIVMYILIWVFFGGR